MGGGASVTSVAYSDRLPPDALDPVVVTKEDGTPLTNPSAPNPDKPIMRPQGFPPEVFITKGEVISDLRNMKPDNTFAADLMLLRDLSRFKQGGPLDMQRLTGEFDTKYVDYATIAIGLHNAAAGLPRDASLLIQNLYAHAFSTYPEGTPMSADYPGLPVRNVINTDIGYAMFKQLRPNH